MASMNLSEFNADFKQLKRDFESSGYVFGDTGSSDLTNCSFCLFSSKLVNCYRSTHSTACQECTYITHCHSCQYCHHSSNCVSSDHCSHSAYLVLCSWCSECTYCFGCVGLHKKDFHILNVRYPRDQYFAITKRLRRELGLPS